MLGEIELTGYGRRVRLPQSNHIKCIPYSNMIHFIEEGSGYFNGIRLTKGQGFICRKNILCEYVPDKNDPWTYSWINVTGSGAEDIIRGTKTLNDVFYLPESIDILKEICHTDSDPAVNEMRVLSILLKMFSLMERSDAGDRDYVSRAINIFKDQLDKNVSIACVADELNISRGYLRNLFFEKTGMSPKGYLMDLKMQRAEFLLKKPYSISEVALSVGYCDVLQFSRIFTKYHGMSPKKYRSMHNEQL